LPDADKRDTRHGNRAEHAEFDTVKNVGHAGLISDREQARRTWATQHHHDQLGTDRRDIAGGDEDQVQAAS
jgi:hypothetical protein